MKKLFHIGLTSTLFLFVFWSGFSTGFNIHQGFIELDKRISVERLLAQMEKKYPDIARAVAEEKNDTYGGKTPEETWQLYRQALLKNDINLAIHYFAAYSEKDKNLLRQHYTNNPAQIQKESSIEKLYPTDHHIILPPEGHMYLFFDGDYQDTTTQKIYSKQVVFSLNSYTGIWKIFEIFGK